MALHRLRFVYPPALISEPIIYQLGRQFGVVTNIRRANVTKDQGWVIIDLEGTDEDVARAVRWAEEKGMIVERVEGKLPD